MATARQRTTAAVPAQAAAPAQTARHASLVAKIAGKFGVDSDKLLSTLKATAFRQAPKSGQPPQEVSNEQMMSLLVVADQYGLNPFTREIFAFSSNGGIVPIVSVDGWIRIINERPELTSISFEYAPDDSEDVWIECTIKRSDRDEPVRVREYLAECRRDTNQWKDMPRRMLRHKALIQCARVAFGFGGVYDPDEGERFAAAIDITPGKPATAEPVAAASAGPSVALLTQVPVAELRATIDAVGIPETEFCAHFEIGSVDELPLNQVQAARDYLASLNRV